MYRYTAALLEHPLVAAAKETLGPAGAKLARVLMDNPVLEYVQKMVANGGSSPSGGGSGGGGGLAQRMMDAAGAAGRMLMTRGAAAAPVAGAVAATAGTAAAFHAVSTWDRMIDARSQVITQSTATAKARMEVGAQKSSRRLRESKAAATARLDASIKKNLKGGMSRKTTKKLSLAPEGDDSTSGRAGGSIKSNQVAPGDGLI